MGEFGNFCRAGIFFVDSDDVRIFNLHEYFFGGTLALYDFFSSFKAMLEYFLVIAQPPIKIVMVDPLNHISSDISKSCKSRNHA